MAKKKTNNTAKVTTKKDKKDNKWQKPELTDVSGRVMAQPYIRFT